MDALSKRFDRMVFYPCNSCGYPISRDLYICPDCDTNNQVVIDKKKTQSYQEFMKDRTPGFHLVPDALDQKPMSFEGKSVEVIFRENSNDDKSVSNSINATIEQRDGKWYIRNNEPDGELYIKLSGEMELTAGTRLILGQTRIYSFKPK